MGAGRFSEGAAARTFAALVLVAALTAAVAPADGAQRLYLSGGEDGLRGYTLPRDGVPMASPGATTPGQPGGITIGSDRSRLFLGSVVYAGGVGTPVVSSFGLDPDDGSPALQGEPAPATAPTAGIVSSRDGSRLYAANGRTGYVTVYGVGAAGDLTPLQAAETIPSAAPSGVALAPDGQSLYVADNDNYRIFQFAVGPDGLIAPLDPPSVRAGDSPSAISITPDGRFVYAPGQDGKLATYGYRVTAEGTLEALPDSPFPAGGNKVNAASVSPDGRHLYTASSDGIMAYEIGAAGSLTPVPGSPFRHESDPVSVALDADGEFLYTTTGADADLQTFAVDGDGSLGFLDQRGTGLQSSARSLALTPAQPPQARVRARATGSEVSFDATGSRDPDGSVARYDWDFGDGTRLRDGGRRPTHAYRAPGLYIASVTVTDADGCSTEYVAAGQTAYCNGSQVARASVPVLYLPGGTPQTEPPPGPLAGAGLRLDPERSRALRRRVEIGVSCERACAVHSAGSLALRGRARNFAYERKSRELVAGRAATIRLKLRPRGAQAARRARAGVARVKVVAIGPDGRRIRDRLRLRLER